MKKTLALALTAAMAISAIGASVSAADMSVKGGVEFWEQTATVTVKKTDISGDAVTGTLKDDAKVPNTTVKSTKIAKFIGWTTVTQDANSYKDNTDGSVEVKPGETKLSELFGNSSLVTADEATKTLYPVYRLYKDVKEQEETLEKEGNADNDADSAKNREEALKKLDAENNATDNAKEVKDGVLTGKVTTSKANVKEDVKGVGIKGNPTTTNASKNDPFTDKEREHLLKVCTGSDKEDGILAYLYDVSAPDNFLSGKNARVTLPVASTAGMKVTVYHVVDAYKAQKVAGVNVGTNEVTFWGNSFSPYMVVLTPKDSTVAGTSTGNPGTGDFSAVPVALLAAAALGATGFVAYKKRKAE